MGLYWKHGLERVYRCLFKTGTDLKLKGNLRELCMSFPLEEEGMETGSHRYGKYQTLLSLRGTKQSLGFVTKCKDCRA